MNSGESDEFGDSCESGNSEPGLYGISDDSGDSGEKVAGVRRQRMT